MRLAAGQDGNSTAVDFAVREVDVRQCEFKVRWIDGMFGHVPFVGVLHSVGAESAGYIRFAQVAQRTHRGS